LGRVVSQDEMVEVRERARRENKRFVFTNGCFDLLHRGHVSCLEAARRAGDLLAVGLNSDASVRKIKGEKRPLMKEQDRAYVVAALRAVDYVCLFDETTPEQLIRRLVPDILVKGGDYRDEQIVGRDIVEGAGGKVVVVDEVAGHATRSLVSLVVERYCGGGRTGDPEAGP
jgi:rfaE bifunctional protein nucleotidyltransferase chain/domain